MENLRESVWDRHGVVRSILEPVRIPRMARLSQRFDGTRINDFDAAVDQAFARPGTGAAIRPGQSVAITAGSRGVANIAPILRAIVRNVRQRGGLPFIFPAMGSHGGATAEGQQAVLEGFGITEAFVGAPIRATMETRVIGHTPAGREVHIDRFAAEAGGVIVVGRVKPHTAFRGEYESGLMKMMAIGMGKQKGAEICHADGFGRMAEHVPAFGKVVLERAPILFGIAILENGYDDTCRIEALPRAEMAAREPGLLEQARKLMPQILVPRFDILVIDQIGKNLSGDGADPNISGTYCTPYASGGPEFQRYVILDLTEETHGNALGVGMADITTKRLYDKADFDESYPNSLTSRILHTIKMPIVMASDRLALQAAIYSCIGIDQAAPRIVRIANTSHIGTISVSEALLPELASDPRIAVLEPPAELCFDPAGNLF